MDYGFKLIDSSDYEMVKEWNDELFIKTLDKDVLPNKGVVVFNDQGNIFAAHLFFNGSGVAHAMLYRNPNVNYRKRRGSTVLLVKCLTRMCLNAHNVKELLVTPHTIGKRSLMASGFEELLGTGFLRKKIY